MDSDMEQELYNSLAAVYYALPDTNTEWAKKAYVFLRDFRNRRGGANRSLLRDVTEMRALFSKGG